VSRQLTSRFGSVAGAFALAGGYLPAAAPAVTVDGR
jgi:hypothetical protein